MPWCERGRIVTGHCSLLHSWQPLTNPDVSTRAATLPPSEDILVQASGPSSDALFSHRPIAALVEGAASFASPLLTIEMNRTWEP